jgi:signal transduction histidine kinase
LLENAVAATDVGATIALACRGMGEELLIEVEDEGVGIPLQDLPRIFDRFSRVQDHRGRANGGTGLGLSITKAIVEAHGGSIDVDSEPGRGTIFRIVLPGFRPAETQPRPAGSAATPSVRR